MPDRRRVCWRPQHADSCRGLCADRRRGLFHQVSRRERVYGRGQVRARNRRSALCPLHARLFASGPEGKCARCKVGPRGTGVVLGVLGLLVLGLVSGYVLVQRESVRPLALLMGSTQLPEQSVWRRLRVHTGRIQAVAASLAVEAGVVVLLAVFGLAEAWEVAALAIGLVALTVYAVADKSSRALRAEAVLKTTVVFLQSLAVVLAASDGSLESSTALKTLHGILERASLTLTGLACLQVGPVGEFWVFVAIATSPALVCGALAAMARSQQVYERGLRGAGTLAYLFVFPLVQRSLAQVSCVPDPTPGSSYEYLDATPWIRCGSHAQIALAGSAVAVLVAVCCGVVWVSRIVLSARARKMIHVETESERRELLSSLRGRHGEDEDEHPLAFLWEPYRDEAWWFEAVVLVRRVAIACSVALIPRKSVFVGGVLVAIVGVSLGVHIHLNPLRDAVAQWTESAALVGVLAVLRLTAMMDEAGPSAESAVLSWGVVGVAVGVVGTAACVVIGSL
ncbi:uncharacterized protein AMSG_11696 [Thecamonas trahens ATCC 50062]|uniref:Uncharacterized protein n=1 Tax=Thecamonas trahens ATCC 50062 TaxID=461836 RepID=A0A0L0DVT3_THETB|nr:hypothetical protein AMSG_11696 [Thecamonas trahens ATCC 50062]KNC56186.1 hypothetical protein AMSG_11696 [Thecamonas trahens ATCC 50062]|eukprot:XP_013761235.1 hypothetical protein AMSG_11696 [Thecamonas trahens ATCC 50062]